MKYPVGVKDPVIREWMAKWAREWEVYAPRPIEVFGAAYPGDPSNVVTITSGDGRTVVSGPVQVEVPDGAEAVVTVQGYIRMTSGSGNVSCTWEIMRGGAVVSRNTERQAFTTPDNAMTLGRTVVERLSAGVHTYAVEASAIVGTTVDFVGLQWQVEIRPAKPRTFDRG